MWRFRGTGAAAVMRRLGEAAMAVVCIGVRSPGDNPLVVTVGAIDDASAVAKTDDTMSTFSSAGPTSADGWLKPDLVASGRSVVS